MFFDSVPQLLERVQECADIFVLKQSENCMLAIDRMNLNHFWLEKLFNYTNYYIKKYLLSFTIYHLFKCISQRTITLITHFQIVLPSLVLILSLNHHYVNRKVPIKKLHVSEGRTFHFNATTNIHATHSLHEESEQTVLVHYFTFNSK